MPLFTQRLQVILLAIVGWTGIAAFCPSYPSLSKSSSSLLASTPDNETTNTAAFYQLLDESVASYAEASRQQQNDDKSDLVSRIEDIVFKKSKGVIDVQVVEVVAASLEINDKESAAEGVVTQVVEKQQQNQQQKNEELVYPDLSTLDDITNALDQQLFHGLPDIVTDEEMEDWVGRVNFLHERLRSHLSE